jgi:hypothetical protein
MPEAVYTPLIRLKWVTGWLTGGTDPADGSVECGDYTSFPMEITGSTIADKFDKLAEIFYRAKYAQFTENNLGGISGISFGVTSGSISPRVMWSDGEGLSNNYLNTGYWTFDENPFDVYAAALPFLGEQYTENYWDALEASGTFRDINESESGMWLPNGAGTEQPKWNNPIDSIANGGLTTNAFSWGSRSASGTETQPTIPVPWVTDDYFSPPIYEGLEISVGFSGRVGVVYGGVAGDLFHADNRFFLEMLFSGEVLGASYFFNSGVTESGFDATSAVYTMRLSTGDLSCPLNCTESGFTGDIIHQVTEWWSYAKDSPALPVWNTTTGEKL